jgi:hypothetical protein
MSEKSSEAKMREVAWASGLMRSRIAPIGSAQSVETRIRNTARRLGWKFSRAKDVWYEDRRVSMKPVELRQIEEITGVKYGLEEVRSIDALVAQADALLMGTDPDFVRAFVAALRSMVGAADRAGAAGGAEHHDR